MKKEYVSPEFENHKFDFESIMGQIAPSQTNPDYNEDHNDDNDGNLGD